MKKTTAPTAVPANQKTLHSGKKVFRAIEPYIWIAPSVILMAIFIVIPICKVFQMSMNAVTKTNQLKGFNNFENFIKVVKAPAFSLVLKNTLVWTIAVVVLSTVLGFILALILNNKFRGRKVARAIVVFPWATTLVIQASAWGFIINKDYGTLNTLLMKLHIISQPVNWTPTPEAYFAWEIACGIFVTVPFVTFCVLSGLQSIDASYYEAATVDGATYWQKLFKITLPLVKPTTYLVVTLGMINAFQIFDQIAAISKQSPLGSPAGATSTVVTFLYQQSFSYMDMGYGSAAAMVLLGIIFLLSLLRTFISREGD